MHLSPVNILHICKFVLNSDHRTLKRKQTKFKFYDVASSHTFRIKASDTVAVIAKNKASVQFKGVTTDEQTAVRN
jgi:hypothetical protein